MLMLCILFLQRVMSVHEAKRSRITVKDVKDHGGFDFLGKINIWIKNYSLKIQVIIGFVIMLSLNCVEATQTCQGNYFYNTTSSLCQSCQYGQIYVRALERCISCDGSCTDYCAYQSICMQCNSTQVFDLSSFSCINSCNATTSVLLSNAQFSITTFCRGFDYYVDPTSTAVVELGTKQFPYKSLALVFVEMLNYHSNTARTINIYLKENTESYVDLGFNYIINMMTVNILPYSTTSSNPSKATIIGGEQNSPNLSNITAYFNSWTSFNLLKNTQLRKSQMILSNFSASEISYLSKTSQIFSVHRTNFTVNNIIMKSVFNNINTGYTFLYAIYLQNRNFNLTNIDFRVSGVIFETNDPLNFTMINIDVDFSRNVGGFNILTTCNYPEAYIEGMVNVTNIKAYYPTNDRLIDYLLFHFLKFTGSGSFNVNGAYFNIYSTFSEFRNGLNFQTITGCNPMSDTVQYVTVSNTYITLPFENSYFDKYLSVLCQVYLDTYRHHSIYYNNITSENVVDNIYSNYWIVGNSMIDGFINNFKAVNVSSQNTIIIFRRLNSITMKNLYFENCTASNQYMLMAYQADNITISNITLVDVIGANTDVYSFIYITNFNKGFVLIDGAYIYNSSFDQHNGIYIDNFNSGTPSYLTLKNCYFANIIINSQISLINTAVLKNLYLSNITFYNITQTNAADTSNSMVDIGGMDFNTTGSFSINQVFAYNSSISLLNMRNIINTNITNSIALPISNIGYINSTFEYSDSIINLKSIEIDSTLQLQISNILMSDITFIRDGNLILFQQQTKVPMIVTNSIFQNVYGGGIQFKAYNKNNLTLTTNIIFVNMTATNCNSNTQSFMTATTGSVISVYNSSFVNNCNYMNGAVASAEALSASISFYNSVFQNNTAVKGAVFNVDNQGYISCTNCTIQNNFAIQSGVIQASNDGYFGIYSSVVSNNYAFTVPIGELFLASVTSIISNCTISNNVVLTSNFIVSQLTKCDLLCFMLNDFKTFISQNTQLINTASTQYGFQLISGNLQFDNTTLIQNQNYFVSAFQSSLSLTNVTIQNCLSYLNIISISYSSLSAANLTLTNITKSTSSSQVISVLFESSISMNNLKYTSSNTALINVYSASLTISNIKVSELVIDNYLATISHCYNITFQNSTISSLSSTSDAVINLLYSSVKLIQNVSMSNINTAGFILDQSNATTISMLSLLNISKGLIVRSYSAISNLLNSTFAQLGSSSTLYGGAIDVTDSILNIINCSFGQNQAKSGAAISIRCLSNKNCDNQYSNTSFNNNKAELQGGVIYYNFKRPKLTSCIFYGNSAPYGPIIASYPIKIVEKSSLKTSIIYDNMPSGIKMDSPLVFALQDYDGQTIPDSIYQVKINPVSLNASTAGYNSAKATSGVATFNNLIFVSSPGAQHVTFKATSNAIDVTKNTALNMSTFSSIDVSFRFCMPGEAQISRSLCQTCAPGTFSFTWNSTACQNCLNSAVCAGGTDIEVNPEYWRISTNSTTILDCPFPAACLGGFYPDSKYPVKCTTGYKSYLCSECDIVDGEKYIKTSGNQCTKCASLLINALKFGGLITVSFAFLTMLVTISIRKKKENHTSILMRIMANYVQLMSVSMSFKVKFPVSLTQLFGPINMFGSTSDTYLSYDCFISNIQITAFTPSPQLFKILLNGILPLILFAVYFSIWFMLYIVLKKWFSNIKRNLFISIICIIFMLHPTITESCLKIFECTLVDENDKRMDLYMEYKCYSIEHFFWIGTVAIPILAVWVIGAPVFALVILYKHRKNLEEGYIKEYMLILFQGLRPNAFYWEFVNTLRKGLVLCCSVFLSTISSFYQVLTSVIILIIVLRLQISIAPYKNHINNELEQNAINACIATLLCGIIFLQTDSNRVIFNTFTLVFLVVANSIFIIKWTFFLFVSFNIKNKKFMKFMTYFSIFVMKRQFLESYATQQTQTIGTVNILNLNATDNMASTDRLNKSSIKRGKKSSRQKLKKPRISNLNPKKKQISKGVKKVHKKLGKSKFYKQKNDSDYQSHSFGSTKTEDLKDFSSFSKKAFKVKKAAIDSQIVKLQQAHVLEICNELDEIENQIKDINPLNCTSSQNDVEF